MASPNPSPAPLYPAFASVFQRASGPARVLRFDAFMALALYDESVGYYRRDRVRVGRDRSADFYTATSIGPLFGELVAAACAKILVEAGEDPAVHTFVELGAEPSGGVLSGVSGHPFAGVRALRLGEPLVFSGPCVVFSNELFDAQPVRRLVRRADAWHELGVELAEDEAALREIDFGPAAAEAEVFLPSFAATPEGYIFDAPRSAAKLAADLASQPWRGLFVAFDYGKTFAELAHSNPEGTARAYHRHVQSNDLLAQPGEQDLTAHVCWDWLAAALAGGGCQGPTVESQESFLVHHAGPWIAGQLARERSASSPRKRALMHLLHPAQMGQKFQVLHALKPQ